MRSVTTAHKVRKLVNPTCDLLVYVLLIITNALVPFRVGKCGVTENFGRVLDGSEFGTGCKSGERDTLQEVGVAGKVSFSLRQGRHGHPFGSVNRGQKVDMTPFGLETGSEAFQGVGTSCLSTHREAGSV